MEESICNFTNSLGAAIKLLTIYISMSNAHMNCSVEKLINISYRGVGTGLADPASPRPKFAIIIIPILHVIDFLFPVI